MTWDDTAVDWDQIDVSWDGNTGGALTRLSVTAGTGQAAIVGQAYPTVFQVTAFDGINAPVPGVAVTVTAPTVGASGTFADTGTNTTTAVTDPAGVATFPVFTANLLIGLVTLGAAAVGVPSVFWAVTQRADVPASVVVAAGGGQQVPVDTLYPLLLRCVVTDQYGNGCGGVRATYTLPLLPPNATFPGSSTPWSFSGVTDGGGNLQCGAMRASTQAGRWQTLFTLDDYPAVPGTPIDCENVAGPVSEIHAYAGTPQGAAVGTVYPVALTARVTDSFSNPKPGEPVTFTAPDPSPSGTFADGTKTAVATSAMDGAAVAPAFTADQATGSFQVAATITAGVSTADIFLLTNLLVRDPAFDDSDYEFVSPDGEGVRLRVLRGKAGRLMPTVELWEEQVPGVPGYRFLGARHTGRELNLPCLVESPLTGLDALRQLARVLDPTKGIGSLRVNLPDGTVRQIGATYTGGLDAAQENWPGGLLVPLVLRCPDPYWTDGVTQNTSTAPGATGVDVVNDGDYETWPVITLTGPSYSPILTNTSSNLKIAIVGTANTQLIVDCRPGRRSVTIDGTPNYSALTADSELFPLVVGSQRITITNPSPTAVASFTWARRFLTI